MLDVKVLLTKLLKNADWTFVDSKTGTGTVALPTDWREVYVVGKFGLNGVYGFQEHFIRKHLAVKGYPTRYFGGNFTAANDYHSYVLEISDTTIKLQSWNWASNNAAGTSTINVYVK